MTVDIGESSKRAIISPIRYVTSIRMIDKVGVVFWSCSGLPSHCLKLGAKRQHFSATINEAEAFSHDMRPLCGRYLEYTMFKGCFDQCWWLLFCTHFCSQMPKFFV
ncbi:unnamed protein product [Ixodes persulcatus]